MELEIDEPFLDFGSSSDDADRFADAIVSHDDRVGDLVLINFNTNFAHDTIAEEPLRGGPAQLDLSAVQGIGARHAD